VKICIVSAEHSPYGGIGHALRRQVEVLSGRHEVVLIERPEPSEKLARISFASEDHLSSAAVLEEIENAYAGAWGPDLLEVCDYRALGLVPLQARAAGHPLLQGTTAAVRISSTAELLALHDGRSRNPAERRVAELEREQFHLADKLLWPGGDILGVYRRFYGEELLPAAVQVGRPFPVPDPPRPPLRHEEGPLRILFAGRMQRLKGAMDLVDACLRLPGDDWELTLIGADTETAPLAQSVRLTIEAMCEGDPRVRIEEAVPHEELQQRFAEHHLLALPSTFEVASNIALEAMRAGLPVLATPVGAQTEFVEDGVSGWLTDDVGAPALRHRLAGLLEDRDEVERVRSSGEVFAAFRRFTDPEVFLDAYETLRESAPPARARTVAPEEPSVTAVIPYHRAHRYVEEAVGSLLAQTHRNVDVIVVNDGSFGSEDAVLDRLGADPRVQVVAQLQRGDLVARRLGIELASGEYLMMFDADNAAEPEFVSRALAMFREQPELAYVTCWLRYVDPEGKELEGGGYAPLGNRVIGGEEENWDGDTAAVLPRRVFEALPEPFAEQQSIQGDWLLYRRLRERGEYGAVIPEPLVRYRVHPDSILRTNDRRLHKLSWEEGWDWRTLAKTEWTDPKR
jgi:glycosyltransferase involved in cell wall biosynthesis